MSALKAVCVGDIGSIITIYENILNRSNGVFPVDSQAQCDTFQDFCSTHLYLLDRRGSHLKNVAKSFAAASYDLLMQSARKPGARGLRQYLSIYVRVTAGDKDEQGKRLRELVDAGVFVFQGGSPRTKTKDSDPIQQFKLTFRKIYGLADYIGLAERDRFELSGRELREWLNQSDGGTDILLRNLRTDGDPDYEDIEDHELMEPTGLSAAAAALMSEHEQAKLELSPKSLISESNEPDSDSPEEIQLPNIQAVSLSSSNQEKTNVLYLALGFEERAEISALRTVDGLAPSSVVAVRYPEKGRSQSIIRAIEARGIPYSLLDYSDLQSDKFDVPNTTTAVDITGLTKAAIFRIVSKTLKQNSKALVAYTPAESYFPLESSLQKVLTAHVEKDSHTLLVQLKEVLSGEQGPYELEEIDSLISDGTRMKALLAFASAKHERLIQLVEDRDYDLVRVVVDSSKHARATVAKLAAEVATRGDEAGSIEECNIKDPNEVLQIVRRVFRSAYIDGGMNFEVGLTGDKLEALAVAAFCAVINVNSVWYVKPQAFDPERFTAGAKNTTYYSVSV